MNFKTLRVKTDERGVVYLELNLPDKRNALSAAMIYDLTGFVKTIGAQKETRVVVLIEPGMVFCAGG